jgi:glycosyltransferase involved in cell wall biosynthesis
LSPKISILIPTHNRAASLRRLLDSLEASACLEETQLEIIVVNNHSTDATSQVLMDVLAEDRKFPILVFEELKHGKSWALNLGLRHVTGSLVLLLDDDVSVDKFCVAEHVAAHKDGPFDAVQGKVLAGLDPEGQPPNIARLREYNIPTVDHGDASCEVAALPGPIFQSSVRCLKRPACLILGWGLAHPGLARTLSTLRAFAKTGSKWVMRLRQ